MNPSAATKRNCANVRRCPLCGSALEFSYLDLVSSLEELTKERDISLHDGFKCKHLLVVLKRYDLAPALDYNKLVPSVSSPPSRGE